MAAEDTTNCCGKEEEGSNGGGSSSSSSSSSGSALTQLPPEVFGDVCRRLNIRDEVRLSCSSRALHELVQHGYRCTYWVGYSVNGRLCDALHWKVFRPGAVSAMWYSETNDFPQPEDECEFVFDEDLLHGDEEEEELEAGEGDSLLPPEFVAHFPHITALTCYPDIYLPAHQLPRGIRPLSRFRSLTSLACHLHHLTPRALSCLEALESLNIKQYSWTSQTALQGIAEDVLLAASRLPLLSRLKLNFMCVSFPSWKGMPAGFLSLEYLKVKQMCTQRLVHREFDMACLSTPGFAPRLEGLCLKVGRLSPHLPGSLTALRSLRLHGYEHSTISLALPALEYLSLDMDNTLPEYDGAITITCSLSALTNLTFLSIKGDRWSPPFLTHELSALDTLQSVEFCPTNFETWSLSHISHVQSVTILQSCPERIAGTGGGRQGTVDLSELRAVQELKVVSAQPLKAAELAADLPQLTSLTVEVHKWSPGAGPKWWSLLKEGKATEEVNEDEEGMVYFPDSIGKEVELTQEKVLQYGETELGPTPSSITPPSLDDAEGTMVHARSVATCAERPWWWCELPKKLRMEFPFLANPQLHRLRLCSGCYDLNAGPRLTLTTYLPRLKVLTLRCIHSLNVAAWTSRAPQLVHLSLESVWGWTLDEVPEGAFPRLLRLFIRGSRLTAIPSGWFTLRSLRWLSICESPSLVSLPDLSGHGEGCGEDSAATTSAAHAAAAVAPSVFFGGGDAGATAGKRGTFSGEVARARREGAATGVAAASNTARCDSFPNAPPMAAAATAPRCSAGRRVECGDAAGDGRGGGGGATTVGDATHSHPGRLQFSGPVGAKSGGGGGNMSSRHGVMDAGGNAKEEMGLGCKGMSAEGCVHGVGGDGGCGGGATEVAGGMRSGLGESQTRRPGLPLLELSLKDCSGLHVLPTSFSIFTDLRVLNISGTQIKDLPEGMPPHLVVERDTS